MGSILKDLGLLAIGGVIALASSQLVQEEVPAQEEPMVRVSNLACEFNELPVTERTIWLT